MRFIFRKSLADDVWNWQEVANHKGSYGLNWRAKWPKDMPLKDAKDKQKMRSYLQKKFYRKGAVQKYIDWLQVVIDAKKVNEIILNVTGHRIPFDEVKVTVTTYGRCPYDAEGGGFFIYYGAMPKAVYKTAAHECMHFVVHKYYWKQIRYANLSIEQAHDIKEALTVLLNPIFIERFGSAEEGYPSHKNLRKDIEKIAAKTDNFDDIITKTIKLYQRKYFDKVS